MAEDGEDTPLTRVDGHFQIWIRIKKHALFQASGTKICNKTMTMTRAKHQSKESEGL